MKKLASVLLAFLLILSAAPVSQAANALTDTTSQGSEPALLHTDTVNAGSASAGHYSSIMDEESSHSEDNAGLPATGAPAADPEKAKNDLSSNSTASAVKEHVTEAQDQYTGQASDPAAQQLNGTNAVVKEPVAQQPSDQTGGAQNSPSKGTLSAETGVDGPAVKPAEQKDGKPSVAPDEPNDGTPSAASNDKSAADDGSASADDNSVSANDSSASANDPAKDDSLSTDQEQRDPAASSDRDATALPVSPANPEKADPDGTAGKGADSKHGNSEIRVPGKDAADTEAKPSASTAADKAAAEMGPGQSSASGDRTGTGKAPAEDTVTAPASTSDTLKQAADNETVREERRQPEKSRLDQFMEKKGLLPKVSYLFTEFGKWLEGLVGQMM